MANTFIHKSESRGDAIHGWLHRRHTFSFANYYNSKRMNFGALRVLNDDYVAEGMGFRTHAPDSFTRKELPLLYATIYIVIALAGAGKYSVDNWIFKKLK